MSYVLTTTSGEEVEITDQMLDEAQSNVDELRPEYYKLEARHETLRRLCRHLYLTKCEDAEIWDELRQTWYAQAADCRALTHKIWMAIGKVSPHIWLNELPGFKFYPMNLNFLARNAADRCRARRNRYAKAEEV